MLGRENDNVLSKSWRSVGGPRRNRSVLPRLSVTVIENVTFAALPALCEALIRQLLLEATMRRHGFPNFDDGYRYTRPPVGAETSGNAL
jgi:hypothetical protein